jgi:serine/threonine-protein kinase RsbW
MNSRPPATIVARDEDLRSELEQALSDLGQPIIARSENEAGWPESTSKVFIELPSNIDLVEPVADYLTTLVDRIWSLAVDHRLSLSVALREALVNGIKHGNHNDPAKLVRITVEISSSEATFTVEDEGGGFKVNDIPSPKDPDNLLKSSGRGVLLIKAIMNEARYNVRGNQLTMTKKRSVIS